MEEIKMKLKKDTDDDEEKNLFVVEFLFTVQLTVG